MLIISANTYRSFIFFFKDINLRSARNKHIITEIKESIANDSKQP